MSVDGGKFTDYVASRVSRNVKSYTENLFLDSASIHSEADTYDDLGKNRTTAMRTINPNPYSRQMPTNSGK